MVCVAQGVPRQPRYVSNLDSWFPMTPFNRPWMKETGQFRMNNKPGTPGTLTETLGKRIPVRFALDIFLLSP